MAGESINALVLPTSPTQTETAHPSHAPIHPITQYNGWHIYMAGAPLCMQPVFLSPAPFPLVPSPLFYVSKLFNLLQVHLFSTYRWLQHAQSAHLEWFET